MKKLINELISINFLIFALNGNINIVGESNNQEYFYKDTQFNSPTML